MEDVASCVNRWAHVKLQYRKLLPIQKYLAKPAPHLIDADINSAIPIALDLFQGQGIPTSTPPPHPHRHPIPHCYSDLSGLLTLEISSTVGTSTNELLHVLVASPSLNILVLDRITVHTGITDEQEDREVVMMLRLSKIHLIGLTADYCRTFLPCISAPSCAEFVLVCEVDHAADSTPTLSATIGPFIEPLMRTISASSGVTFGMSGRTFTFKFNNGVDRNHAKVLVKLRNVTPADCLG